jgi:hypothetical protein
MKNYLSKNWKKILYFVTIIIIVFNTVRTVMTPNTIIDDYYKYGPEYVRVNDSNGNSNINSEEVKEGVNNGIGTITDGMTNVLVDNTGIPPELARGIIVFTSLFLVILILSSVLSGGSSAQPAKKK